ncbi:unnamed protein product, partial [Meganyctiphanes norvegica]
SDTNSLCTSVKRGQFHLEGRTQGKLAGNMATLGNFDETKEVVLTTDASPMGLGAFFSHKIVEGDKSFLQPVAYASRSFTTAEKNYAQIEHEILAVFWEVKYFRQYIYCHHFTHQ